MLHVICVVFIVAMLAWFHSNSRGLRKIGEKKWLSIIQIHCTMSVTFQTSGNFAESSVRSLLFPFDFQFREFIHWFIRRMHRTRITLIITILLIQIPNETWIVKCTRSCRLWRSISENILILIKFYKKIILNIFHNKIIILIHLIN